MEWQAGRQAGRKGRRCERKDYSSQQHALAQLDFRREKSDILSVTTRHTCEDRNIWRTDDGFNYKFLSLLFAGKSSSSTNVRHGYYRGYYRLFDPLRRSEIHPDCHTLKSFGLRAKTVALAQPSSITIMDLEGANCL